MRLLRENFPFLKCKHCFCICYSQHPCMVKLKQLEFSMEKKYDTIRRGRLGTKYMLASQEPVTLTMVRERHTELTNGAILVTTNNSMVCIEPDMPVLIGTGDGVTKQAIKSGDVLGPQKNDTDSKSVKKEATEITNKENPQTGELSFGFVREIFSWRGAIYLLLHLSLIALNLPKTSTNMALVCINTKRAEVLKLVNISGLVRDIDVRDSAINKMGNNSGSAYNRSQSVLEEYSYIMNDINWHSSTVGLVLSGSMFLSCIGPVLFDAILQKVGSRLIIFSTLMCNAGLMVTSPLMARSNPFLFLANRILIGLTAGANVPVIGAVLPQWTPDRQRLTATAIVFAGDIYFANFTQ
ncbi:hypothetical protein RRG08_055690 [Elysia crispata]|uniref:Major facilitator superfamily (MFS) profile domain-containing protein n=1 Tax=Elysia crispata TaxID=231223 RepID=A0AAE0Z4R7_9GAST|nr:hypothetical protein RRG08_055690 [Elysia crispata]